MKSNVTIQETIFKDMVNQLYKDDARIKELEDTIRDLCKTIRMSPYGWCGIERVEAAEKILNKE